jgi:hypothetical protein
MRFENSFKKNLLSFAVVALVLSVIAQAASAAWLSGWDYRKEQTITGSTAGAQTNYQMKMTVHKGSGTDSAADVYCGGNCRDDFGDIRWTTSDGTILMDYWIESVASGDKAVFWIEIPSIPASPSTVDVYMYYGKSDATSESDGDATFMFFDDFTGTNGSPPDSTKWINVGASINNNKLRMAGYGTGVASIPVLSQPFVVEYKYTPIADGGEYSDFRHYLLTLDGHSVRIIFNHKHSTSSVRNVIRIYEDGVGDLITPVANPAIVHGTEYAIKIIIDNVNKRIKIYVDDVLKVDYDASAKTFGNAQAYMSTYTQTDDIDTYQIHKYASPEPTWGTWGPPNTPPVANAGPNQVAYAWIDGIADVTLDGSASYDADGDELTYLWTWSIDGNDYEANGVSPTIELPVGEHRIELVVNDGIEDSEPNEIVITVVGPIKGALGVVPRIINGRGEQPRITAILRLPAGITKDRIDNSRKLMLYPGEIEASHQLIMKYYERRMERVAIFASFDSSALVDAVGKAGLVQLDVVGQLKPALSLSNGTGQYYYGSDMVRIINPPRKPPK